MTNLMVKQWLGKCPFRFGKLLGVFPFVYHAKSKSVSVSNASFYYSLVLNIVIITVTPLCVREIFYVNRTVFWKVRLFEVGMILQYAAEYLTISISYLRILIKTSDYKVIVNEGISLYQDVFYKSLHRPCDRKLRLHMFFLLTLTLFYIAISIVYFNVARYSVPFFSWLSLCFYFSIVNNLIDATFTHFYVGGMLYSAHLYRLINQKLSILIKRIRNSKKVNAMKCCDLSDDIDELNQMHSRIHELTHKLHDLFSHHLLFMYLKVFTTISVQVM